MDLVSCLASGLVLVIMGVAFFIDRFLYIKKANIAIATVIKIDVWSDAESTNYAPSFKFTANSNQEIIFEHRITQRKYKWAIGDKIKVAYQESILDIYNPLPLIFYDAFGLSALLMTIGIFLLITSGCIYWEASRQTCAILLPAIMVPFVSAFYIWVQVFFKKLQ
jgi:hypothetical protein